MKQTIKEIPFFKNCSETELETFIPLLKEEFFNENKIIFQKGDNGHKMYFILSGKVKIYEVPLGLTKKIFQSFSLQKEEKEISVLNKGDFFGEIALVSQEPRLFSARALTDTQIFSIHQDDLQNLIKSNPEAEKMIAEILIKRILENSK